jgi:hypothetical protein
MTGIVPLVWANNSLTFAAKTVLVYENQTGPESHRFVVRLARFQPDIFLEWESFSHQGTIHLRKKAVADANKLTVGGLFEAGVDVESKDVMTNWLPAGLYSSLIDQGKAKAQLNRRKITMQLVGEGARQLVVNQVEVEVPVLLIEDSQGSSWIVHKDPRNPVLIEYRSQHYHMQLKRISTSESNNLRWIKKLPPVK